MFYNYNSSPLFYFPITLIILSFYKPKKKNYFIFILYFIFSESLPVFHLGKVSKHTLKLFEKGKKCTYNQLTKYDREVYISYQFYKGNEKEDSTAIFCDKKSKQPRSEISFV